MGRAAPRRVWRGGAPVPTMEGTRSRVVRSDMDAQTLEAVVYQARNELDRDEADLYLMERDLELLGFDPGAVAEVAYLRGSVDTTAHLLSLLGA